MSPKMDDDGQETTGGKKVFKLRKQIKCHSADIRAIVAYNGGFVTGSRDKQAKAFLPTKGTNAYNEVALFTGPQHFVSCLDVVTNGNEVIIYVGSNDENIYCYTAEAPQPMAVLSGHHGTVCALGHSDKGVLISGSWDQTARVWTTKDNVTVLSGHQAAVWAVAFIGESPLTASADKTIKLWNTKGDCTKTLEGHQDVVRGLVVLNGEQFVSCANDATLKFWTTSGTCTATAYGHDNYIYSLSRLPPSTDDSASGVELVTCSEDRCVKYWVGDQDIQTIRLPASTLWSVTALDSHNFAVAASNGTVYIFTSDPSKVAPESEQVALEEEVSKSSIPMSDLGEIKTDQLPGSEVLMEDGKRDGQTKLVKEGTTITCFQWSAIKREWTNVGEVVGAAGASKDPSQKTEYEGKDYDYVFSVDVEDGKPALKLPYNVGQNPYDAAQQFIYKHNLDQMFLEQVSQFIIKNSQAVSLSSSNATSNTDPFTGGGSYHTSSNMSNNLGSSEPANINYDPFTGGSSYSTGGEAPAAPKSKASGSIASPNSYFPHAEFLSFDMANVEGIAKKLKEFSDVVPPEVQLTSDDLKLLLHLSDATREISPKQIGLLKLMIQWPKNHIFPVLDLLRLALLLPQVNQELCSSKDSARLVDTLLVCASDVNSNPNQLLSLRVFCNMFAHPVGESLMAAHIGTVLKVTANLATTPNKNIQIALATLYINYSILTAKEDKGSSHKIEALIAVTSFLGKERIDSEGQFRLLVALGNLCHGDIDLKGMAQSEEVLKAVRGIELDQSNPEKVKLCARHLVTFLK